MKLPPEDSNVGFSVARHTYCARANACGVCAREAVSLRAIENWDSVRLLPLDLFGGQPFRNTHWAAADRTAPDNGLSLV